MLLSLAEYVRRLIARDLDRSHAAADVALVFDLGLSGRSDTGGDKGAMIAEAYASGQKFRRRFA